MKPLCFAALAILVLGTAAQADGTFFPTRKDWLKGRERSLINEPAQKAVLYFRNGQETLIISPSYQGSASDFAWVVPTPSRPKVDLVEGALFHELAAIFEPEYRGPFQGKGAESPRSAGARAVTVIEEKEIGSYHVAVLEANDGKALMKWLDTNGYALPDGAKRPVEQYVKEKWTFVASKIRRATSAAGLRSGTLAPLRLTFAAKAPIYPMRLSGANPMWFTFLVYLVFPPGDDVVGGDDRLHLQNVPYDIGISGRELLARGQSKYRTLARLFPDGAQLFMLKSTANPKGGRLRDLVWRLRYLVKQGVYGQPVVRRPRARILRFGSPGR